MKKSLSILLAVLMALTLATINIVSEGVECTESPCSHVAAIGGVHYESLQEAVKCSEENDVITLISDIDDLTTVTIDKEKIITLELNGKTIRTAVRSDNNSKHYYAIDNYGFLEIIDSSEAGTGSIYARGIENLDEGIMTIRGGNFYSIDTNGGAAVWNEANLYIYGGFYATTYEGTSSDNSGAGCLNNGGYVYIDKGIFKSVNKRTYSIISTGEIEISPEENDDVVVSGAHGGLAVDSGTAIVNGGFFSSTDYYGLYVSNDGLGTDPMKAAVTVNGGEFNGPNYSVWIGSDYNNPVNSTIEINDGTFKKPLNAQEYTREGAIQVKGGSYIDNPVNYVADGYKVYDFVQDEGFYYVARKPIGYKANNISIELGNNSNNLFDYVDVLWEDGYFGIYDIETNFDPDSIDFISIDDDGYITTKGTGKYTFEMTFNDFEDENGNPVTEEITISVYSLKQDIVKDDNVDVSGENNQQVLSKETSKVFEEIKKSEVDNEKYTVSDNVDFKAAIESVVNEGKTLTTKLIAEEVETDNADSSIQESMLSKAGNGSNLATMVDVQVGLYVDSTKVANINKLENEVTLSFEIPESLRTAPQGYKRIFKIIRLHNTGSSLDITELESELSEDGNYVLTTSDKFSLYGLIYIDEKIPAQEPIYIPTKPAAKKPVVNTSVK